MTGFEHVLAAAKRGVGMSHDDAIATVRLACSELDRLRAEIERLRAFARNPQHPSARHADRAGRGAGEGGGDSVTNPIPLSAPDGTVYVYACGECHRVHDPYDVPGRYPTIADVARQSRVEAEGCCPLSRLVTAGFTSRSRTST